MTKKILGSHMKRLLAGVSEHGRKHLTEVETDLIQARLLLKEAIQALSANFLAINEAFGAQQPTIDLLLAGGTPSDASRAALAGLARQMEGYFNAVVINMQFEDMTNQLLDRASKRVTGLREFLGTLGVHGEEILPESGNDEIVELLNKVSMALAIQSLELRSVLRKAVSQQHLKSGDIELF
jgi:hypothetical protein